MVKLDKGSIAQAFVVLTFGHAATRLTSSLQDALRAFGEASLTLVAAVVVCSLIPRAEEKL